MGAVEEGLKSAARYRERNPPTPPAQPKRPPTEKVAQEIAAGRARVHYHTCMDTVKRWRDEGKIEDARLMQEWMDGYYRMSLNHIRLGHGSGLRTIFDSESMRYG